MCLEQGTIHQKVITDDNPSFSLEGMVKPTFQNVGANDVLVGEWKLPAGSTFPVDMPFVLTGEIAITFLGASRDLRVSFGMLTKK